MTMAVCFCDDAPVNDRLRTPIAAMGFACTYTNDNERIERGIAESC